MCHCSSWKEIGILDASGVRAIKMPPFWLIFVDFTPEESTQSRGWKRGGLDGLPGMEADPRGDVATGHTPTPSQFLATFTMSRHDKTLGD